MKALAIGGILLGLFVQIVPGQPANDSFAGAWHLAGTVASTNGSSALPANATKEAGEPNHAGLVGGRSVWFSWTAPVEGVVRVSTAGSQFNTLLAVYTGNSVNALSLVASNDNFTGQGNTSRVAFNADPGTTYRIAVDGRNNSGAGTASGNYALALQMMGSIVLAAPADGSMVIAGTPIPIAVTTTTPNPPVSRVDFWHGTQIFASQTVEPFTVVFNDAPLGTNSFRAVMTDSLGQVVTSAVANVVVLNPGVTMASPADGAVFLNSNPIDVSAIGILPAASILSMKFYADDGEIGESAAPPFSTVWSNVTAGVHHLVAVGLDEAGLAHTSAPVTLAVARVLVPTNSTWKYLDTGSDQGTNWVAPSFDDAGWASGPAQLGYGDGDEATVVGFGPNAAAKFTTTYFRHVFPVTNASAYTNLVLRVQRDDGAVVHLNGFEAARLNMPTGQVTFATFASSTSPDDGAGFVLVNVPAGLLLEDRNVVAAEIHQSDLGSSDISFNLELLGVPAIPRNAPPIVRFLNPTNGQVILGSASVAIEIEATDPDGSVAGAEFFADGVKLGEGVGQAFTFTWPEPAVGTHVLRVVVRDNAGASSVAAVSVLVFDPAGSPLVRLTRPLDNAVFQGPTNLTLLADAVAINGLVTVQFLAGDAVLGESAAAPFSFVWTNAAVGVSLLRAVASDSGGLRATSAVVRVLVDPPPDNTQAPTILRSTPDASAEVESLTSIQIAFSERVTGLDAADLLINGLPAATLSGAGSNYTFNFPQPPYGLVAINWSGQHEIVDLGVPALPFDAAAAGATWSYALVDRLSPTIVMRDPAPTSTVTNLTQITVVFSEGVRGVEAADLLVNGVPATIMAAATDSIYTFGFPQPASGAVNVAWAAEAGIIDLAESPNLFVTTGPGATWTYTLDARTILVQSNAQWRLLKGTVEASTPADAWRAPTFDDSGWSNALAPFYYGDPYSSAANPGTLLSDMQNNYSSIYLRRRFNVPNLSAVTNLLINAQSDDGFIAWINGVEVVRYNLPAGEIPYNGVTPTSTAEPNGRGAAYLTSVLPDPIGYLLEGENVLAIHAFNQSLTASSDFGFNAQLYTYLADASVAGPRVLTANPAPGEVFDLTSVTVVFTEPVTGVDATDLLIDGVPALTATSTNGAVYEFGFVRPAYGEVAVSWATDHGILDLDPTSKPFDGASPTSILRYTLLNPSRPTIAGVSPSPGATVTNLLEVTVRFSESVTGVDPGDLRVNGVPAATVVMVDDTQYAFGLAQPPFGAVTFAWAAEHGIVDREVPPNDFDPTRPGGVWSYHLVDPAPQVAFISPTDGTMVQTPVNIGLAAAAVDLDGVIVRVEFFAGADKIGEDTTAPYAATWRNPSSGAYVLTAVATDDSGRTAVSAPVSVTVNPGPSGLVLSGAIWKYLDDGSDRSNAWREVTFDDSAWASGRSELGYGDASDGRPEATVVSFGTNTNNKIVATYFRHAFVVTDPGLLTNLVVRLVRDDGAAVYLNGVEVVRDNLPAGELTYLTLGSSNVLGADETRFFIWPIDPARLIAGTNHLAVEVHQNLVTSADVSFDLELIANVPPEPPTVVLSRPANDSAIEAPADVILQAAASDSDGFVTRVEFFEGVNRLGEATNAPYVLTWPSPAPGRYELTAVATDQSGLQATSAPVRLTVLSGPMPLVSSGSIWKYLDNGTDPGGAWRDGAFDDSRWATGPAQLGYGDGDESTVVSFGPDAQNKYITTYFRQAFVVADPSAFISLTLDLLRDDGAVVYLNGIEVFRDSMPSGPVDFLTLALNGSAGETTYFRTIVSPALLVAGTNIVGVEVHQDAPTSSDVSFDLRLVGATSSLPLALARGPYLQVGTATSGVVRWRTDLASDAVVFYGTDPAGLSSVAVDATLTNEHIVVINGLQPDTRYYYSIGSSTRTLASGVDYWFVTSPVPGTPKPTRFWVLGDSGTANNNARNVRDAYYNFAAATRPADVWLMLGDNAYQSGTDAEYQAAVFNLYPATLRNLFLWPTIGNHETSQSFTATDFPYLHIFSLPRNGEAGGGASGTEKYYSFDYANVHLVCLDSMSSGRSATSPMAQWLQNDLATSTADWTIVFFHHPPYTRGSHNSDAETELIEIRQNILPILEAYGVDLVLCGHSHAWERSFLLRGHYGSSSTLTTEMKLDGGDGREDGTGAYRKDAQGAGTVYVVAGNGGQISGGSLNHPAHFLSLNELGSMVIDVVSNRLEAIFLATNGVARDQFTLHKAPPVERLATPANLVALPGAASRVNLFWTDLATNELGFVVQRSIDGTNFAAHFTLGSNRDGAADSGLVDGVTYYYRVAATNETGQSDFSNVASITAGGPAGAPAAPGELVAASGNGVEVYRSQIILRWRDHATNEAGFQVERSPDGAVFVAVGTVGANATHYVDRALESGTAYYYRVRSFNLSGISRPSNLAGDETHPQSSIALAGETITFQAGVEGQPPIRYQWRFLGASIVGETNQTLSLPGVQPSDEGSYNVVITDAAGRQVSNPAYLFVLSPPRIVSHPSDSTITAGTTARLTVVAEGSFPREYRWFKDGVPVPGAVDSTLAIPAVDLAHQGGYQVVVANDFGTATSRVAQLTVNRPPVAVPDLVYRFPGDESLAIEMGTLLENDADPDGDLIRFLGVDSGTTQGGVVSMAGRYVLYQPPAEFLGADQFNYTIGDARGAIAAGVVRVERSDNTPPALAPVPDYHASVLTPLTIALRAVDRDVPANALGYVLEAGAPTNARIDPETGLFRWMPTRGQAPGTNVFTLAVWDDGVPSLSDRQSFRVIVDDYVELWPGNAAVRSGERGSVGLTIYSTAELASLTCALRFPTGRLTNITVETLASERVSVALEDVGPDSALIAVTARPGHSLKGLEELVRVHFTASPGQESALHAVQFSEIRCVRSGPGRPPSVLAGVGRVAVIGLQSLLGLQTGASGLQELVLYGIPGISYGLETTTNAADPSAWRPWRQVTLTNLVDQWTIEGEVSPARFFRAKE